LLDIEPIVYGVSGFPPGCPPMNREDFSREVFFVVNGEPDIAQEIAGDTIIGPGVLLLDWIEYLARVACVVEGQNGEDRF